MSQLPLMNTYRPLPITLSHGEGVFLWDTLGNRYLDCFAGISVNALGHSHPHLIEALTTQGKKLWHCSNVFENPEQMKLASRLTKAAGMKQIFFANSGAEANECALKLARRYGHQKNSENPLVITMEKSFHGRTLATLSASGNPKIQKGFDPLLPGFIYAPYDNLTAIETLASTHPNIVGIMVEPIQGEGGIRVPRTGYLSALRTLCDEHDWLLIIDEIQTGMGRTGRLFASEHEKVVPDIMTLAKALGNGFPVGACLSTGKALDLFQPTDHGSTFGGNPLAMSVCNAVLDVIDKSTFLTEVQSHGEYCLQSLKNILSTHPHVRDIRGKGLLIGIELDVPARELIPHVAKLGLLINVTAENVIRIAPPLIIQKNEIDWMIEKLAEGLGSWSV